MKNKKKLSVWDSVLYFVLLTGCCCGVTHSVGAGWQACFLSWAIILSMAYGYKLGEEDKEIKEFPG